MTVDPAVLRSFRNEFRGEVITPLDPGYEQARRVWNAMIDKRPALVVRPRSAVDVRTAVNVARDQGLPIAVRGGAHNVSGRSTCDAGMVIDFAAMKGIRVDAQRRRVRAEPGLRWAEFDRETQAFGLATTGGTVGDTGIAGLTLGGGFGWLEGVLGMTVDNVTSADLVLANGEVVTTSADEHPDLFWAIRGGGGNFGVVTSFEYQLHEIGPTIVGGMVVHPFGAARDMLRFYRDMLAVAPDPLIVAAVLLTLPDGQKACAIVAAYAGPVDAGLRAVAPIKAFGTPMLDTLGPTLYVAQQSMLEDAMPPDRHNYWKSEFVQQVTPAFIDYWVEAYARVPSPQSSLLLFPIHGAAARVAPDATAFPHRGGIAAGIYALWSDRAETDENVAWVRGAWDQLRAFAPGGVYVNELGDDEGDDRVREAYGANYPRLQAIKARYDPANVFCLNANIQPALTRTAQES